MSKAIRYDESFKKEAVRMYVEGDVSATAIARQLKINRHNFYRWIKEFNNGVVVSPKTMDATMPPLPSPSDQAKDSNHTGETLVLQMACDKISELEQSLSQLKSILAP